MRRARRWVPWALVLVAAAVLAAVLTTPQSGQPLDPANPGRDGGQALARVLDQEGVDVEVVSGTRALVEDRATAPGPGTTVLLPHTAYLGAESGPALLERLTAVDRVVVVVPSASATPGEALGLEVDVTWSSGTPVLPDCDLPEATEGDRVSGTDVLLSAGGPDRSDVTACYPPGTGHNAGGAREGALLDFPATDDRPRTTVVGLSSTWTNAGIAAEANAAVALRLLGGSERLLWVDPQPGDAGLDAAGSLWDVLPRNLTASVWIAAVAALALAVWRGRRLGPVVAEPLPAVVHAAETTRSRGRLYRQASDRTHALEAVRAGSRRRIAPRLGLPRGSTAEQLVAAVADATGRSEHEVADLLGGPGTGPPPADDAALVRTVRALRALEEQVSGLRSTATGSD